MVIGILYSETGSGKTKCALGFEFGCDKNPAPVVAQKDMDIGVD